LPAGNKTLNDGEEDVVKTSHDREKLKASLMTTDEDALFIHRPGETTSFGWVRLIDGNSGWDVVNDYTTNLEILMERRRRATLGRPRGIPVRIVLRQKALSLRYRQLTASVLLGGPALLAWLRDPILV
jgi:hypothetical protein